MKALHESHKNAFWGLGSDSLKVYKHRETMASKNSDRLSTDEGNNIDPLSGLRLRTSKGDDIDHGSLPSSRLYQGVAPALFSASSNSDVASSGSTTQESDPDSKSLSDSDNSSSTLHEDESWASIEQHSVSESLPQSSTSDSVRVLPSASGKSSLSYPQPGESSGVYVGGSEKVVGDDCSAGVDPSVGIGFNLCGSVCESDGYPGKPSPVPDLTPFSIPSDHSSSEPAIKLAAVPKSSHAPVETSAVLKLELSPGLISVPEVKSSPVSGANSSITDAVLKYSSVTSTTKDERPNSCSSSSSDRGKKRCLDAAPSPNTKGRTIIMPIVYGPQFTVVSTKQDSSVSPTRPTKMDFSQGGLATGDSNTKIGSSKVTDRQDVSYRETGSVSSDSDTDIQDRPDRKSRSVSSESFANRLDLPYKKAGSSSSDISAVRLNLHDRKGSSVSSEFSTDFPDILDKKAGVCSYSSTDRQDRKLGSVSSESRDSSCLPCVQSESSSPINVAHSCSFDHPSVSLAALAESHHSSKITSVETPIKSQFPVGKTAPTRRNYESRRSIGSYRFSDRDSSDPGLNPESPNLLPDSSDQAFIQESSNLLPDSSDQAFIQESSNLLPDSSDSKESPNSVTGSDIFSKSNSSDTISTDRASSSQEAINTSGTRSKTSPSIAAFTGSCKNEENISGSFFHSAKSDSPTDSSDATPKNSLKPQRFVSTFTTTINTKVTHAASSFSALAPSPSESGPSISSENLSSSGGHNHNYSTSSKSNPLISTENLSSNEGYSASSFSALAPSPLESGPSISSENLNVSEGRLHNYSSKSSPSISTENLSSSVGHSNHSSTKSSSSINTKNLPSSEGHSHNYSTKSSASISTENLSSSEGHSHNYSTTSSPSSPSISTENLPLSEGHSHNFSTKSSFPISAEKFFASEGHSYDSSSPSKARPSSVPFASNLHAPAHSSARLSGLRSSRANDPVTALPTSSPSSSSSAPKTSSSTSSFGTSEGDSKRPTRARLRTTNPALFTSVHAPRKSEHAVFTEPGARISSRMTSGGRSQPVARGAMLTPSEDDGRVSRDGTRGGGRAAVVDSDGMEERLSPAAGTVYSPRFQFPPAGGGEKKEHLYKILVIGELGTGKTSIIKRYVHQFFSQHYRATIGVDFALKVLNWDADTLIRLQLWDIAGQERFGNMTRVYYKEAVGAFVVFDVTRASTFEAVTKWKNDLDSKVQLPDGSHVPCVLLANKCDQAKEGMVNNSSQMDEFCQQKGFIGWYETSAKENINIDDAARFLVTKILEKDRDMQLGDQDRDKDRVVLTKPAQGQQEKKINCC